METQTDLIDRTQFASLVPASPSTVKRWARDGIGPRPIKIGPRMVRYRREDVEAFLAGKDRAA